MKTVLLAIVLVWACVSEAKLLPYPRQPRQERMTFPSLEEVQAEIDARSTNDCPWLVNGRVFRRIYDGACGTNGIEALDLIVSNVLMTAYSLPDGTLHRPNDMQHRYMWLGKRCNAWIPITTNLLVRISDYVGQFEDAVVTGHPERLKVVRHSVDGEGQQLKELHMSGPMNHRCRNYNRIGHRVKASLLSMIACRILWSMTDLSLSEREALVDECLRRAKASEQDRESVARERKETERHSGKPPSPDPSSPVPSLPQRQAR